MVPSGFGFRAISAAKESDREGKNGGGGSRNIQGH
jgi:hypothetical protein